MQWQYSPYLLPSGIAAIVAFVVAILALHRRTVPGALCFATLAFAIAEWSLGYTFELASANLAAQIFWAKIEYVGIVFTSVAWFAFALGYTDRRDARGKSYLTRRVIIGLSILPLITLALVWTNEHHSLIWSAIRVDTRAGFAMLDLTHGIWFWIVIGYSYLLLLLGTILLIEYLIHFPQFYRGQTGALLVGAVIPWIANAIYILGLSPFPHLDLTPLAFTLSAIIIAWGIFRRNFLNLVPVARNTIIESMHDGVIVLDAQKRVVDANPAALQMIGRPATEIIGQPAAQVFSAWPQLIERYRDVTESHEEVVECPGEARRVVEIRASALFDHRHRITGRLFNLRDITERRRAQEALHESEERFRRLSEATFEGIAIHEQGKILDANHAFAVMFGYAPTQVIGMFAVDLVAPAARAMVAHAIAVGLEEPYETTALKKDGAQFPIEVRGKAVLYQSRTVRVVAIRDITERKRAEAELKASEQYARGIIDQSLDMIVTTDNERRIVEFNRAAEETFGYARAEVLGKPIGLLYANAEASHAIRAAMLAEGKFIGEISNRRKNGEVFTSLLSAFTLRGANGETWGVVGVSRDISDRKRAERDLRASEQRYQTLFAAAQRQAQDLELLHRIRTALARELDVQDIFRVVIAEIARAFGYTQISLYTLQNDVLKLCHQVGYDQVLEQIPITQGIMGRVVRTGKPVLLEDVRADPAFLGAIEGVVSEVCVPLIDQGRVAGTLNVESTNGVRLTESDLNIMIALGEHITLAIERTRLFTQARASEEKHRLLLTSIQSPVLALYKNLTISYCNDGYAQLVGKPIDEIVGQNILTLSPAFQKTKSYAGFLKCIETGFAQQAEGWWGERYYQTHIYPTPWGIIVLVEDITERKQADERLRYLSIHDGLTDLYNRAFFEEEMARLERSRQFPVSIMVADVDGLKVINDQQGHAAGDQLLQRAAHALRAIFRAEDMVARIGGDEFAALLPRADIAAAEITLTRIRTSLAILNAPKDEPPIMLSLGAATAELSGSLADAFKQADARMYAEKASKRAPA
ncbi:MAG: PAS domain S-box protein [Chloroflexi bacterium]|nr:PAS domain S-box protein [Chloroflexota bacterium]